MKKLLVILLVVGIYLNRSYAYFYDFLDQHHLEPPAHEIKTMISNKEGQTLKYVSLGDSLTAGVGTADYKNSYPYLLAQKLSSKNSVELTNLARAGDNSSDVLATQLPQALSQKPDMVTLLIGTNDIHNLKSRREFQDNLTQITSQLKKSRAKVYLLSIPYLGSSKTILFPYNLILDFRTKQFNAVIKKVAIDYQVSFVDLYPEEKPAGFYSADEFHPSGTGYSLWATYIINFIL